MYLLTDLFMNANSLFDVLLRSVALSVGPFAQTSQACIAKTRVEILC